MVLCILPDRRSDAGVPDDWRAANRRSESRGGITGKPFIGWPPSHTGCYDDNDSVPDLVETNMLELNINRESTDRDKFDDGQELFGNTYCPGSGSSWGYGALPRDEDWGVIFAEMPAWVRPPGTTYTSRELFINKVITTWPLNKAAIVGDVTGLARIAAFCFLGRRMRRSKPNLLLRRAAVVAAPALREAGGAAEQRHRDATDFFVHHKEGGTQ